MHFKYLVLSLSFLVISCTNHSSQFLLETYENRDPGGAISIMTIESEPLYDQFQDHLFGALRPAERQIFNNQLVSIFSSKTHSPLIGKFDSRVLYNFNFELREYQTESSDFEMITPVSGSDLKTDNIQSRFVVILDQYHFTPYSVQTGGDSYAGHEGEIQARVRLDTKYLIWDNKAGDAIAWGDISSNQRLNSGNQSQTYRELLSLVFEKIVGRSPFEPV